MQDIKIYASPPRPPQGKHFHLRKIKKRYMYKNCHKTEGLLFFQLIVLLAHEYKSSRVKDLKACRTTH